MSEDLCVGYLFCSSNSSQLTEQVSHQSKTKLIFKLDFVKYYIKSCSHMYILPYSAPTAVPSLISTGETLHLQDYPLKEHHKSDCISIK